MTPALPCDGPPEGSYHAAAGGWLLSNESSEWLYKPSSDVYFHSPSESLWKKARDGQRRFIRLDDVSPDAALGDAQSPPSRRCYELAVAALSMGGAGTTTLLRVCFGSWNILSGKAKKFEEMQQDLLGCCEGMTPPRPRGGSPKLHPVTSPPQLAPLCGRSAAADADCGGSSEGIWPGFALLLGLPEETWFPSWNSLVLEEIGNDENSKPNNQTTAAEGRHHAMRSATLESANLDMLTTAKPLSLTTVAIARHNLHRSASGLGRSKSKDLGARLGEFGMGLLADVRPPPCHDSLPAVHLEREAGWRNHVRRPLPEELMLAGATMAQN